MYRSLNYLDPVAINLSDERYRITSRWDIDELIPPLKEIGLLRPPLLVDNRGSFIVVSGFRRLAACRKLGWEGIDAGILCKDATVFDCAKIAVAENALDRPLNLIEQARAVKLLRSCMRSEESLVHLCRLFRLPHHPSMQQKLEALIQLPHEIQGAIASGMISLAIAMELLELHTETAGVLTRLFCDFKIGTNKQKDILVQLKEISSRDNCSIEEILTDSTFQTVLNNEETDRVAKTQWIRHYLRQKRFPLLTEKERQFQLSAKKLDLDPDIKLTPPPFFEGDVYEFRCQFKTLNELENKAIQILETTRRPEMEKILER